MCAEAGSRSPDAETGGPTPLMSSSHFGFPRWQVCLPESGKPWSWLALPWLFWEPGDLKVKWPAPHAFPEYVEKLRCMSPLTLSRLEAQFSVSCLSWREGGVGRGGLPAGPAVLEPNSPRGKPSQGPQIC